MDIFSRSVGKNMPRDDGTPRREKGYRAFVGFTDGRVHWATGLPIKVYATSPLFQTEAEAKDWLPVIKQADGE